MGQDATRALHRLRGHEKRYHASVRSPAVWLLPCSPIPSSRFDCSDLNLPLYLEALCVCCRGRDWVADLYLEASGVVRSPSSISRGLLPQAQLSVCLFVYLGKDLYPLGNTFFPSSDFAADRRPESLFALAGFTACIGFSCSLVCFNPEVKAARNAHASSAPEAQFIELASRSGSGRNIGWLDSKECHRLCS
jgi:hypothetical protein